MSPERYEFGDKRGYRDRGDERHADILDVPSSRFAPKKTPMHERHLRRDIAGVDHHPDRRRSGAPKWFVSAISKGTVTIA